MAESKTPSTPSIETAIDNTEIEIKKAEERKKEHRQKAKKELEAANKERISDEEKRKKIARAKKYLERYRIVENIQKKLKIQLEALQNCQSAEGEECPNVADNSNSVSEILKEPTESATELEQDEAMYETFLNENPDARPTIDIDEDELVRELSEDGDTAATDSGDEAKKEDGFNVNTWPRPEGSLCSSPDEIWELNDDGKLKISLSSNEDDIKSNDQSREQVRGAPVENLWKKIMKSAGLSERQGISSDLQTSVRKNNAAVRLLGFEADLKKIFKNILDGPAKPNWDDYKARIYLLNNKTILKYKKEICSHSLPMSSIFSDNLHEALFGTDNKKSLYDIQEAPQIAARLAAQEQAEQKRVNPPAASSALTAAATVALPPGAAAAAAKKEAEAKKAADDKAVADDKAAAYESKKYTMPIELIKQKIQIFSTPPTTTQKDRTKLWDLFTTNRESLTKEKIQVFYDKLKDIYGKYNTELKDKIKDWKGGNHNTPQTVAAIKEIYNIICQLNQPCPTIEEFKKKTAIESLTPDMGRLPSIINNDTDIGGNNLIEDILKPLLITYTIFMYNELKDDTPPPKMPSAPSNEQKHYLLLPWSQLDRVIFRYVTDGLFLLYKNGEIHKPDIFDVIVTIHILYNCEYGSEFRGVDLNILPSLLMYKRVRYYCDRLYPEIFDILDMSEMIEASQHISEILKPAEKVNENSIKEKIKEINKKAVREATGLEYGPSWSAMRAEGGERQNDKNFFPENLMKLLKHHMGYFKLFKDFNWKIYLATSFGMYPDYIPLIFTDYKITIKDKKKESKQEKRIFQPGLSWFKHLLERGSNAYYWLYTSLLIALKEEFIDNCGEITCDDQEYYGSDIMTNILNTLTCEINANGQIDTKGKNYTNITQFIPRAIEIYEEMNESGRMDAMEKEADSKLEKKKPYKITSHGKRYYTRVPDFDDELIMKRHEIKRELVSLLINKNSGQKNEAKLYKTVFNAGLNNILIPIGKKSEEKKITERSIKHGFKKTDTGNTKTVGEITFCSFDDSDLIHKWYIEDIKEAELKNIKRKTKRCRKKVSNKTRKKRENQRKKKLEKLQKKKKKDTENFEKIQN